MAPNSQLFAISSAAHTGLKEVLRAVRAEVTAVRAKKAEQEAEEDENDGLPVISLSSEQVAKSWHINKLDNIDGVSVFRVTGHKIEKFARRTRFDTHEGVNRLRDIMKKMGITHGLNRSGATGESIIRINDDEFPLVEQS